MEHYFTTYVRTKTLFKHRLKDLKDYETVRIYKYELQKLGVDNGPLLYHLKQKGEIDYNDQGFFRACHNGPIVPRILERGRKKQREKLPLTPLHRYMMHQLLFVDLDVPRKDMPVYFKTFLQLRRTDLESFFTVDAFSHRVHTPIVNLKSDLRAKLKFHHGGVVSLDVKQMQPTILAKVLFNAIGENSFSTAINNGEDVYIHLLDNNTTITTRDEAKKLLFQLIFGKPKDDIGKMFKGDVKWVKWINSYKSREEPKNPHKQHTHTNLAWLLQFSEVQVMTDIWRALMHARIPFLTIHDDVLCRKKDKNRVFNIMDSELKKHFKQYKIVVDHNQ